MQFVASRVDRLPGTNSKSKKFTQLLSFYNEAPQEELSLDEFEIFALDRLQLLRGIESANKTKGQDEPTVRIAQVRNVLSALISTNNYSNIYSVGKEIYALEKGRWVEGKIIGLPTKRSSKPFYSPTRLLPHWGTSEMVTVHIRLILSISIDFRSILRPYLTQRFLLHERLLFKFRLDRLSDLERQEFMSANGLHYESVTSEERSDRRENLIGLAGVTEATVLTTTFYKWVQYKIIFLSTLLLVVQAYVISHPRVPFQQALNLISSRSVYLERGYAFVPLQRLVSIIVTRVGEYEILLPSNFPRPFVHPTKAISQSLLFHHTCNLSPTV